jgi:TPR repeat protein
VAEAKAKRDASLAKLAAFGVGPADLDLLRSREVAKIKFDDETYDQLQAEAAKGDPAVLALQCAVALWGTASRQPDEQNAIDICHDAAEAGDPAAHVYYGYALIEEKLYVGADTDALDAAAVSEFKKAADLGSAWGEVEYGLRLREGEGVAADPIEAERLFMSAQAKGLPAADRALGRLYLSGLVASPGDDEAFALVKKAADAGDPEAQFFYGEKLEEGMHISQDLHAALAYYKMAAASGDPDVAFNAEKWTRGLEERLAREAAEATAPAPASPAPN